MSVSGKISASAATVHGRFAEGKLKRGFEAPKIAAAASPSLNDRASRGGKLTHHAPARPTLEALRLEECSGRILHLQLRLLPFHLQQSVQVSYLMTPSLHYFLSLHLHVLPCLVMSCRGMEGSHVCSEPACESGYGKSSHQAENVQAGIGKGRIARDKCSRAVT